MFCSFTNTSRHDITEILLKVALNTIKQTNTSSLSIIPVVNSIICNVFELMILLLLLSINENSHIQMFMVHEK